MLNLLVPIRPAKFSSIYDKWTNRLIYYYHFYEQMTSDINFAAGSSN